jgi:hypothetical protein
VSVPDVSVPELQAIAAATQRAGVWVTPTLSCTEFKYSPGSTYANVLRQIVKALQEAGVGLLLGQDDGFDVHHELAALVRAGLTPYQALRTGTHNPAQYFGILDSAGTVAVGKRADLVLLSGDPLRDIRHTREPAGVMIGGRWFDRAALDRRLLISPSWLRSPVEQMLNFHSPLTAEQSNKVKLHMGKFWHLSDSLKVAKPSDRLSYGHVLRLLANELGAIRATLTPEQHVVFDSEARVWLREQARQGYRVMAPGIALTP